MPENAIIPAGEADLETVKEKFERERLSRRQALKRLGMTSAMAAFALFSVDDLARMVGKAMQQRAGDNKVAEQVAQEFQQAGIAFAGGLSNPSGTLCISDYDCSGCNQNALMTCCQKSSNPYGCCAKSNEKGACCGFVTTLPGQTPDDHAAAVLACMLTGILY